MDGNRKRTSSNTSLTKKRSKKSRFQTVRIQESTSVASSDSESVASTAQEVTVNNFNYHSTANGRLNHRSTRRRVAPHPAEGIFSKTPAPCSDDLELASVLEAFPAEDPPSTDNLSDNAGASKAKRTRADLKAAVQCTICFHITMCRLF